MGVITAVGVVSQIDRRTADQSYNRSKTDCRNTESRLETREGPQQIQDSSKAGQRQSQHRQKTDQTPLPSPPLLVCVKRKLTANRCLRAVWSCSDLKLPRCGALPLHHRDSLRRTNRHWFRRFRWFPSSVSARHLC